MAFEKIRWDIVEHPYGIIKRQWFFCYVMTKKTIRHASADVRLIFTAFNLRRIFNIIGHDLLSFAFLKKAKSYIAKYQRESLDLFACYDFLKHEKSEILDQFVQDFMKEKMDDNKIANLFEIYHNIDKAGIFYPILIQELTFLGEKVFAQKRDSNKIYEEVKQLIFYLNNYANRKLREDIINDFSGSYCKFSIRIIGKQFKVNTLGEQTYIKNIEK